MAPLRQSALRAPAEKATLPANGAGPSAPHENQWDETRWLPRFNEIREVFMLTRRGMLLASIAAGVAMNSRDVLGKAAQPSTPVKFDVPAGACDCHTHIHADPEKFPFFAGRVYTPELASPQEMSELHRALGIERVVIVTPSIYGTDNSATLFGMRARGPTARSCRDRRQATGERSRCHAEGRLSWHPP